MSYSSMVMEKVRQYPELKIIDTQKIHTESFKEVPEPAFYKAVSRMAKAGEIQRLAKGIYCRPRKGRFGAVISNERNIIEHYLGQNKNKGVVIGYQLFNNYELTTQVSKTVNLYSNMLLQENKNIYNIRIQKAALRFDVKAIKLVELLEVLQNYMKIEELNKKNLIRFILNAVSFYDENTLERVTNAIKYKKSTLASLKQVLDYYKIENSVDEYLSGTSKYKAINMEGLYESASGKTRI